MSERFIDFLLRLAPRERGLLGLLCLVILPAALVVGWLWPLAEERRAAQIALREARALDAWVIERRTEKAGLGLSAPDAADAPVAIGASALEQSLISARLRSYLGALETRGEGEITLRFDDVNFVDLMRWMDGEDPGWGYRIVALRLERTERSARVEARLTLEPARP